MHGALPCFCMHATTSPSNQIKSPPLFFCELPSWTTRPIQRGPVCICLTCTWCNKANISLQARANHRVRGTRVVSDLNAQHYGPPHHYIFLRGLSKVRVYPGCFQISSTIHYLFFHFYIRICVVTESICVCRLEHIGVAYFNIFVRNGILLKYD